MPNSIITDYLNSIAFSYIGIVLFNNFAETDRKIRAIEFFSISSPAGFQLNV